MRALKDVARELLTSPKGSPLSPAYWRQRRTWWQVGTGILFVVLIAFVFALWGWSSVGERVLLGSIGLASIFLVAYCFRAASRFRSRDATFRAVLLDRGALALLGLAGLAVGTGSIASGPIGAVEREADLAASEAATLGRLITADAFDDPEQVWPTVSDPGVSAVWIAGVGYEVRVTEPRGGEASIWSSAPDLPVSQRMRVEVDVEGHGTFGLFCNRQPRPPEGPVYFGLTVSTEGRFAIVKHNRGSLTVLAEGRTLPARARSHALVAECLARGGGPIVLALELDGDPLARVWEGTNLGSEGKIGILAAAAPEEGLRPGGLRVVFRQLRVEQLVRPD